MINKPNNFKIIFTILSSIILFTSCQPDDKQIITNNINDLETRLFETKKGVINTKEAANMIHAYISYVDTYPTDTMSAKYLFKAADVSINTFHSQESIKLFDRLLNEYPNYGKTPHALFLKAFTYENYLGLTDSAQKYYQIFIEKYPNHIFTNDAQLSLQNLGKTPEEVIRGFKKSQE